MTTEEKQERAGKLYHEGRSQQEIAGMLSVSENTLTDWKKRFGWGKRYAYSSHQKRREEAFVLYRAGDSQQEICRMLGVSENTVTKWKRVDKWQERLALTKATNTRNDLIQLGKLVEAKLAVYASDNRQKPAGALRRAYANVCRLLEHPALVEDYAPGESAEPEP